MNVLAPDHRRQLATWLFLCCLVVFSMVVLGGLTRLTGSGLSMVKWEPVVGILPPVSQEDWQRLFQLYQETPEYRLVNRHMALEGFKGIFWLEYIHRVVGRLAGVIFFGPWLYFLLRGILRGALAWKTFGIFLLGGVQGLVGWIMVASGLVKDPHVSHYLLTGHLLTALTLHALMFWLALSLLYPHRRPGSPLRGRTGALAGLILLTIASGGLVAGLKAGLVYNTFPLMGDGWLPADYVAMDSLWHNFFENPVAVQLHHRILAVTTFMATLLLWWHGRALAATPAVRWGLHSLAGMAVIQLLLGIATLLLYVPVNLAATHQAGAMVLLTISLWVAHRDGSTG